MNTLRGPLRKRESHLWSRHPEDWYVEPAWCSERLFELVPFAGTVWDPACGLGRIAKSAFRAGHKTWSTDLIDRGYKHFDFVQDFFAPIEYSSDLPENIVSNPPFGRAEHFVAKALTLARGQVAMLLPANWVQGDKRSRWLESTPLASILFVTPRPSMLPGTAILAGEKPGNGTTDYAWFIWDNAVRPAYARIGWLRRDA